MRRFVWRVRRNYDGVAARRLAAPSRIRAPLHAMTIYLNNAATGFPKPTSVSKAVGELIESPPCDHLRSGIDTKGNTVDRCRRRIAELFNAPDPSRVAFTSGATESLNLAFKGLALHGSHVVTTAVEHNSVLRPLRTLERNAHISLTIVPCDPFGYVSTDDVAAAIRPNTALVVVNHCSNVTGTVNDIEAVGAVVRRCNAIFLVDASQSAGVYPIDVEKMNIDILAFTGHKALHGLQGIGGIYVRDGVEISPLKVGGTGIRSDYPFQPEELPLRFEAGTLNLPGIVSLEEGVKFIEETGMETARRYKESCVARLRDFLRRFNSVRLFPPAGCDVTTTILSFTINGVPPSDICYILENNFAIVTRSGLHCAPLIHEHIGASPGGTVRVSPSWFTTDDELSAFEHAIEQIVQMD